LQDLWVNILKRRKNCNFQLLLQHLDLLFESEQTLFSSNMIPRQHWTLTCVSPLHWRDKSKQNKNVKI
jgi:hypothetical protein